MSERNEILSSEQALLGANLMRPEIVYHVRAEVTPDAFFGVKTKMVYKAILELAGDREVIEPSSVLSTLESQGHENYPINSATGLSTDTVLFSATENSLYWESDRVPQALF